MPDMKPLYTDNFGNFYMGTNGLGASFSPRMSTKNIPLFSTKVTIFNDRIEFIQRTCWFWTKKIVIKKSAIDKISIYRNPLIGAGVMKISHHDPRLPPFVLFACVNDAESADDSPLSILRTAGYHTEV